MGTWEGLGLPINGEFYRYDNDQVQTLFVEESGIFNLTVANTTDTMDNALAITYTTSGTLASGYGNVFYTALNVGGTSAGNISVQQHNAFGADITVDGTHTCGIGGMYIYIAEGTATLTAANIYGAYMDLTEMGAVDYLTCLQLHKSNTTVATTVDSFIMFQMGGGTTGDMFTFVGASRPTYFLRLTNGGNNGFVDDTASDTNDVAPHRLACRIADTTFYLYLYADS